MKTISYNPSDLEVEIAGSIEKLQGQISELLPNRKIDSIEQKLDMDNPTIYLHVSDDDGDKHVVVLKLIQKPDDLLT